MARHDETSEGRSVRLLRVGEQVRHALSDILTRGDVHDDVLASHVVSVTEVRMSPDLKLATAYIMPLGGKDEEAVLKALEISPPELSADIYENGIHLTGGGALLRGLDKRLAAKTKLPIHIAEDPLRAVVRGTGKAIKDIVAFRGVLLT